MKKLIKGLIKKEYRYICRACYNIFSKSEMSSDKSLCLECSRRE